MVRARRLWVSLRWCAPLAALGVLGAACGPVDEESVLDTASAEVSEHVSTVINVHWTTEKPSAGYVEYGPTKALELNTPMETEETTEHKQSLVGLKADTVYYYRVVAWDGDAGASEIQSIRTGYLPPGLPELTVTGTGHDEFVIAPLLGMSKAILIIDPDGDIVWNHEDKDSELSYYRARLARDGKGILYNSADLSDEPAPDAAIVRISFDGSERSTIPIPFLAHDFVEHADGTIGALVFEDREGADGVPVRGNKLVEVTPDGEQTEIWNSWDCFDPEEHMNDESTGWTFTNALDYDEVADVYYVGLRSFSSITRVSRQTAACEWVLGFTASTIDFAQGSARFQHQHQFQVFGDHLLVMDNDGSLVEQESRIIEYELDLENNVATEVWRYLSSPPVYTWVLGEPNRLPNGDTFINWSTAGQLERVSESGENVWQLNASVGAAFGFHSLAKSLYTP